MIAELGSKDYLEGVKRSFDCSLVVIRGAATEEEIEYYHPFIPKIGKNRVYLRPC